MDQLHERKCEKEILFVSEGKEKCALRRGITSYYQFYTYSLVVAD